jgi:hypothetical protein
VRRNKGIKIKIIGRGYSYNVIRFLSKRRALFHCIENESGSELLLQFLIIIAKQAVTSLAVVEAAAFTFSYRLPIWKEHKLLAKKVRDQVSILCIHC